MKDIPKFNLEILSEISRDMGQVFFAAMVVGQFVANQEVNWQIFVWGITASLLSWGISLIIKDTI